MAKKQPLYPHVPKSSVSKPKEIELRFLPDSPEVLTQTVRATGYRDKLASVFQKAIIRAKRSW